MFRWLLIILVLMLAGLQYRLWLGDPNLRQVWYLEEQIQKQKRENQQLTERNHRLEAEVADLKSGLRAIEERARSEMGLIKEGETFFQLIEPRPEQVRKR
ncbi:MULTISPECIES: cell division protein FtsB [Nitrincola]|uniref:Cell division protein FtsB n=2 Tax=Nitrincola TaxID=267849 RepID=A0A364NJF4_9GAMM|nr:MULTISPECIES: cell division protein FtsB [Nitrincola]EXJ12062.1 Cell division protein FtsB [Nitrincola nitratireducens]RAU17150.1 cell division protein FtsB [Nitrincola tibetensis]